MTKTANETPPPRDLADPGLYFNRELSWLAFNERVLSEAQSRGWPLLERVKFLAIYWSNLDEFFMIRVSGLHEQLEAALIDTTPDGMTPRDQLTRIGQLVREQGELAAKLLRDDLMPALASVASTSATGGIWARSCSGRRASTSGARSSRS